MHILFHTIFLRFRTAIGAFHGVIYILLTPLKWIFLLNIGVL